MIYDLFNPIWVARGHINKKYIYKLGIKERGKKIFWYDLDKSLSSALFPSLWQKTFDFIAWQKSLSLSHFLQLFGCEEQAEKKKIKSRSWKGNKHDQSVNFCILKF